MLEVVGQPNVVAKLYHKPPSADVGAKLLAMAGAANEQLLAIAARPLGTVHERAGGRVWGLIMPKVVGCKPSHYLYGPKTRLMEFPQATWPFLVHTAANVARAFAVVHPQGHVVGDVNHGNLLVSERGLVRMIDCDSFQFTAAGRTYHCDLGVSTHQPPELQGRALRGLLRTANHDNFGLAVLTFQLLFMRGGAASWPGTSAPQPPECERSAVTTRPAPPIA